MQYYQRIRDLREDEDLTQIQLAEKLGMYKTTYANYEQGKHTVPLDFAVELARFYDVSLDYIAGLTNRKVPGGASRLSREESELLGAFQRLSDVDKGRVLGMAEALLNGK